jgi:hypothetical protein
MVRIAPHGWRWKKDKRLAGIKDPKLRAALKELRCASLNRKAVPLRSLTRSQQTRLLREGYLVAVMKGWALVKEPAQPVDARSLSPEDFWAFLCGYLSERFYGAYCLAAEASLLRHVAREIIPERLAVITKARRAQSLRLPNGCTLVLYGNGLTFPERRVRQEDGLWVMALPLTLCRLGPLTFRAHPEEIAKALGRLDGVDPLLAVLSEAGSAAAARRLAGAFLCRGDVRAAERILQGADHRGQG